MPRKSTRKLQSDIALSLRWEHKSLEEREGSTEEENDYELSMEVDDQKQDGDRKEVGFSSELDFPAIGDLFETCKRLCGARKLSVLVYMILRKIGTSWRDADVILNQVGAYRIRAAHQWALTFLSGEMDALDDEGRGGKHGESFFDTFPELETEAKAFAIESCSRKSADFTVIDLANFIDRKFYELTQTAKASDGLIRSVASCRLDLRRWGAKFRPNTQRPYFEGHERSDVVAHRQDFVAYFRERRDQYYTISEGEQLVWQTPSRKPTVLICKYSISEGMVSKDLIFCCLVL